MELFDRTKMIYKPLIERKNKVNIALDTIDYSTYKIGLSEKTLLQIADVSKELKDAKANNASRICAFGAHTIKNGLGQLLGLFIKDGIFTHLSTNGAGIIHDWEFAYFGQSSEDVHQNVLKGEFGTWEETGLYLNLGITVGAYNGLGYGESIGKMIYDDGLLIPPIEELESVIFDKNTAYSKRGAACDLAQKIKQENLKAGFLKIVHPYKEYSVQYNAYKNHVPFTDHPMFGHDIIYTHRASSGAAIGRSAEVDFLKFVNSVSKLEKGVYLSIGSAVMSPMIFEKAMSMSRNILLQKGEDIKDCKIHVVDIQEQTWEWKNGEPPMDNPAYYHRFMKSFSRMGCPVDYTCSDNRDYLVALYREYLND